MLLWLPALVALFGGVWLPALNRHHDSSIHSVAAFGWRGHALTGAVGHFLLNEEALQQTNKLLGNTSLAKVAAWADKVKRQPEYQWTRTLHYIDPHDNPPHYCEYIPKRDTPAEGSVGTAILNMTTILQKWHTANDKVDSTLAAEALKFLVHFVGDVHQPMHATGRLRGGNGAKVKFDGRKTNLHSVWDGRLTEKDIVTHHNNNVTAYFFHLIRRLPAVQAEIDAAASAGKTWCPVTQSVIPCVDHWIAEGNAVNCKTVWTDFRPYMETGGAYYERNRHVIETQIIKAGIRIAALLNQLFATDKQKSRSAAMATTTTTTKDNEKWSDWASVFPASHEEAMDKSASKWSALKGSLKGSLKARFDF